MKPKSFFLFVAVLVAFSLLGCPRQAPPPEGSEGFTPATPPAGSEATPAPASSAEAMKITVLVPSSGPNAAQGQAFLRGFKLGVAALGTPVGLSDKNLLVKDVSGIADGGLAAAIASLHDDKPWALVGLPDASAVAKLSPELKKASVPLITCTTGDVNLPVLESYVTRLTCPDSAQVKVLANYLVTQARCRRAVVVADSRDARSLQTASDFSAAFKAMPGATLGDQFSFASGPGLSRLVQMILSEKDKPDLIFLALDSAKAVQFIAEAAKNGLTTRVAGLGWYVPAPAGFGTPGTNYTGIVTTTIDYTPGVLNVAAGQFLKARTAAGITEPFNAPELLGYDAAIVLTNALAKAKTPAELATNISRIKNLEGARGLLTMSTGRLIGGSVDIFTVEGSGFKWIKKIPASSTR